MNKLNSEPASSSNVWPPPPTNYSDMGSTPPLRPKPQSAIVAITFVIVGAMLGFVLAYFGLPPFVKGYTRWAELVPILYCFLAVFLGICARKEQMPFVRAFLWLACGSVSAWTFIEFSVQTGMQ